MRQGEKRQGEGQTEIGHTRWGRHTVWDNMRWKEKDQDETRWEKEKRRRDQKTRHEWRWSFPCPCELERLKALMFGHSVEVKGQGVKKCVYHNRVTNEFLFPRASLICTEVHTSAERRSWRGRETPYGLSDVYKRSPSLIQHWESNHSFTVPYHFLCLDITSRNKEGYFQHPGTHSLSMTEIPHKL